MFGNILELTHLLLKLKCFEIQRKIKYFDEGLELGYVSGKYSSDFKDSAEKDSRIAH